jgi:putative ABC transport system permease protein
MLNRLRLRLRALFHKSKLEEELDDEVRFHLEREIEENIARGMRPEEARVAAMRSFGGVERVKDETRDVRGIRLLEEIWQDLRYSARMLLKNPGFTLIAVITLALGIGANTTIFSVVNAVLINPFPYPAGNRLMTLYTTRDHLMHGELRIDFISAEDFAAWRAEQKSFSEMFGFTGYSVRLTGTKEPAFLSSFSATARFFETLGVKPILGRDFQSEDEIPGRPKVVVISHAIWRDRLDSDPNVIGKTLRFNGANHTVIGVMPPDFKFIYPFDVLFPFELNRNDGFGYCSVIARLKDGVTREQARMETKLITKRLQQENARSGENQSQGANLVPLKNLMGEKSQRGLLILFSATSFVLLIACANLANLLSARASGRHREIAIRAALGAGRRRLVSQLLTESLLLAGIGGLVGILLAWGAIDWLVSLDPTEMSRYRRIEIDAWVLGFTFLSVLVTGALFGLAPALQASKPDLAQSFKAGAGLKEGRWRKFNLRSLLIVGEVGMTIVLLTGAGLMINSLIRLMRVNPGFTAKNVIAVQVVSAEDYRTREQRIDFYRNAIEGLGAIPGVDAVATINLLPFGDALLRGSFSIEGSPESRERLAYTPTVSANYFDVMQIPILKGRSFTEYDTEKTSGVVVISESCARRYFPDSDPIGRRISFNRDLSGNPINRDLNGDPIWLEIVGVTGDVKQLELRAEAFPTVYTPFLQGSNRYTLSGLFVVRSSVALNSLIASIRKQIRALDPELPIYKATPLVDLISETTKGQRYGAFLLGMLSALAIGLSAVGLYGVMSYLVTHRTHEIGIRMALGAQSGDVLRLVIRQGMFPVLIGMTLGLAASLALTRMMRSLLFEVSATDPMTFVVSALLLISIALLACWIPARRATKVDPMVALRFE